VVKVGSAGFVKQRNREPDAKRSVIEAVLLAKLALVAAGYPFVMAGRGARDRSQAPRH
jgi:hypothetical protein